MGFPWAPPIIPPTAAALLDLPVAPERYAGKKILSVHGADDALVPYARGKVDLDAIQQEVGEGMEVWLVEGVGHRLTEEMTTRVAEWVWRWAVRAEGEGEAEVVKEGGSSRL
jgi:predicted esterase